MTSYKRTFVPQIDARDCGVATLASIAKFYGSDYSLAHLRELAKEDKVRDIKNGIQAILKDHKGNYGYRRVHLELRNRGYSINHQKVQRLMQVLGLSARIRKRKNTSPTRDLYKKLFLQ